ncbi:MAG: helix-turn-helix transcriptional regulator [Bacteriovoracaceae bacterium]|nr:helix-turn-helix transcriptional regulator [Bacteriovoracaceae bacterium]
MNTTIVFNEYVANNIRTARHAKRITQTSLAHRIGVNQSTISKIEAGKLGVSAFQWVQICSFLDINVSIISEFGGPE